MQSVFIAILTEGTQVLFIFSQYFHNFCVCLCACIHLQGFILPIHQCKMHWGQCFPSVTMDPSFYEWTPCALPAYRFFSGNSAISIMPASPVSIFSEAVEWHVESVEPSSPCSVQLLPNTALKMKDLFPAQCSLDNLRRHVERKIDVRSGGSTIHTTKSFPPLEAAGCICLRKLLGLSEHENISLSTLMHSEVIIQKGLGTVLENRLNQTMKWAVLVFAASSVWQAFVCHSLRQCSRMDLGANAGILCNKRGRDVEKEQPLTTNIWRGFQRCPASFVEINWHRSTLISAN